MFKKYLGKYDDWSLGLLLIPIINTINYHLTYSKIRWDWYTYTTYAIDTASGLICWWLIRKTIDALDVKMPFHPKPLKRILVQLCLTTVLILSFIILSTEAINYWFGHGKPLPLKFYTYNLFIFFIWILVINGIYLGLFFYEEWMTAQRLREKDKILRETGFEVLLGKTIRHIPFNAIVRFYVESQTTYLSTQDGQTYVLDLSLQKVMAKVPQESFFRLNRKTVVNRNNIQGYKKEVNGKLLVVLSEKPNSTIHELVSRITAPNFKRWLSQSSQKAYGL